MFVFVYVCVHVSFGTQTINKQYVKYKRGARARGDKLEKSDARSTLGRETHSSSRALSV